MDNNKEYTKMILNRLHKRAQNLKIKSNGNSNQKTQATPSDHRQSPYDAKNFFDNFQLHCTFYHSPVVLRVQHKQLRRPLIFELNQLQYKAFTSSQSTLLPPKNRLPTAPSYISEFTTEEPKRSISRLAIGDQKEQKQNNYKKSEERSSKQGSSQLISRYRSLKTIPTNTTTTSSYRRMLVYPSNIQPTERRQTFDIRNIKNERKKISPRIELTKRCDSYEKYYGFRM